MIKEQKVSLSLLDVERATTLSSELNGCLKHLYLSSNKQVRVVVFLKNRENIVVYNNNQFFGNQIVTLRTEAIDVKGERFNYVAEEISLCDDIVGIEVSGPKGTEFYATIVYEAE